MRNNLLFTVLIFLLNINSILSQVLDALSKASGAAGKTTDTMSATYGPVGRGKGRGRSFSANGYNDRNLYYMNPPFPDSSPFVGGYAYPPPLDNTFIYHSVPSPGSQYYHNSGLQYQLPRTPYVQANAMSQYGSIGGAQYLNGPGYLPYYSPPIYNQQLMYNSNSRGLRGRTPLPRTFSYYNPYRYEQQALNNFPLNQPYAYQPPDLQGDWALPKTLTSSDLDAPTKAA